MVGGGGVPQQILAQGTQGTLGTLRHGLGPSLQERKVDSDPAVLIPTKDTFKDVSSLANSKMSFYFNFLNHQFQNFVLFFSLFSIRGTED